MEENRRETTAPQCPWQPLESDSARFLQQKPETLPCSHGAFDGQLPTAIAFQFTINILTLPAFRCPPNHSREWAGLSFVIYNFFFFFFKEKGRPSGFHLMKKNPSRSGGGALVIGMKIYQWDAPPDLSPAHKGGGAPSDSANGGGADRG